MAAPQPTGKPEGKKLRRKLQKIGNQQRNYQAPTTGAKPLETGGFNKSALDVRNFDSDKSIPRTFPSLPLQPDLGGSKWFGRARNSGCAPNRVYGDVSHLSLGSKEPPSCSVATFPELAHLSIHDAEPRSSSDTATSYTNSPRLSIGSTTRRYAKTPILRIGQLEGRSPRVAFAPQKVSEAEIIAESYRALLESRCSFRPVRRFDSCASLYEDSLSEQVPDISSDDTPGGTVLDMPLISKSGMGSPSSDDGTLVGFEEDTIYFKPISFEDLSAPPSPCPLENDTPRSSTPMISPPEDPSLHLCFDLLTRELSSAVSGSPQRPSAETSALQIWVMIEAYEKLRNQVRNMGLDEEKTKSTQSMFDVWLRALYAIHDGMTGSDGQRSESDYGDAEC
jgi:hypothetical protein